jgi:hypothetical protein
MPIAARGTLPGIIVQYRRGLVRFDFLHRRHQSGLVLSIQGSQSSFDRVLRRSVVGKLRQLPVPVVLFYETPLWPRQRQYHNRLADCPICRLGAVRQGSGNARAWDVKRTSLYITLFAARSNLIICFC